MPANGQPAVNLNPLEGSSNVRSREIKADLANSGCPRDALDPQGAGPAGRRIGRVSLASFDKSRKHLRYEARSFTGAVDDGRPTSCNVGIGSTLHHLPAIRPEPCLLKS